MHVSVAVSAVASVLLPVVVSVVVVELAAGLPRKALIEDEEGEGC